MASNDRVLRLIQEYQRLQAQGKVPRPADPAGDERQGYEWVIAHGARVRLEEYRRAAGELADQYLRVLDEE